MPILLHRTITPHFIGCDVEIGSNPHCRISTQFYIFH
jgi:hypothetical protein